MTELEIDAFLTIVKTGSITAAAELLYVSQPALSRRISSLEEELGYSLMKRSKGIRAIELTNEGKAFINLAEKWKSLWTEAKEIASMNENLILNVASVGSISSYIFPEVFQEFMMLNPDVKLTFHNYHSFESYGYVEDGIIDIALISDDMYSKNVETIPAFKEPMVLLCDKKLSLPSIVHPSMLDGSKEIRLPWNPEYDLWHKFWFKSTCSPKVLLDQMSLMEHFLDSGSTWSIVPYSVAYSLKDKENLSIHFMKEGPGDRIIYYLQGKRKKPRIIRSFLEIFNDKIKTIPNVESMLK